MTAFGPTFGDEVIAAGLGGLPFAWSPDGTITGLGDLTAQQHAKLQQVIAAHDPAKQPAPKPTIPGSYVTDAAAAAAGVPLYGLYHMLGAVKVRLT